ncbi:MAG: methyltransferase domain-containing protein [Actinomycetales bacterium]|nr:methyltransferase domain-containing protein [Actinomycetales bacterium]
MLLACWQAGTVPGEVFEIVEWDDGLITATDAVRYFAYPRDWAPAEQDLLTGARGRVRDIGCGAGRHAVFLQQAGAEVIGLDPSPGAAEVARVCGVQVVQAAVQDPPAGLGVFEEFLMLTGNTPRAAMESSPWPVGAVVPRTGAVNLGRNTRDAKAFAVQRRRWGRPVSSPEGNPAEP